MSDERQIDAAMPAAVGTPPGKGCVIFPAYNAGRTIGTLVQAVKRFGLDPIVVNDGSTDDTVKEASAAGAFVVSHVGNRGKGVALRVGFRFALQVGYALIVTMDSDGQHDPDDVPRFLSSSAAVAVGHRVVERSCMPRLRHLTNRVMSGLVSWVAGQAIPDSQCGFRMLRRNVLASLQLSTDHFDLETEMLLAAARAGWQVQSVPIRTIYDGHASHIRPMTDGVRFCWLILRYLMMPRRPSTKPLPEKATSDA